jgi:hypothetical protein
MGTVDALGGQGRWLPVVLASVLALPVAAGVTRLLVWARVRRGMTPGNAWRTALTEVGMVVGTLPWLWMILSPLPESGLVYLVPLTDLWNQIHHPPAWALYQITGNLLVFSAFGFLAPIRWRLRPLWIVTVAATASATVELLQWALDLGRVASVDDVLVNTTGAGLAALWSRRWPTARRCSSGAAGPGP